LFHYGLFYSFKVSKLSKISDILLVRMSPLLVRLPDVPGSSQRNLKSMTNFREYFVLKTFLVTDVKSDILLNVGETPFVSKHLFVCVLSVKNLNVFYVDF